MQIANSVQYIGQQSMPKLKLLHSIEEIIVCHCNNFHVLFFGVHVLISLFLETNESRLFLNNSF